MGLFSKAEILLESQQSGGAVLTLDANDKVTFVGEQTANITAARVKFV